MKSQYVYSALTLCAILTSCSDKEETKPVTPTTTELTAVINGAQQTNASGPAPTNSTATGTFAGTYSSVNRQLAYTVVYQGMTPSIAHIHRGAPGVSDRVEIPFANLASPITGTVTLTLQQEELLLNNRMYVNLHSSAFPNGEIRGNISKK